MSVPGATESGSAENPPERRSTSTTIDGYNLMEWASGGMRFRAVSDLNAAEVAQFRDLILKIE